MITPLKSRILAVLQHGPGTVEEIAVEIGDVRHKTISVAIHRMALRGLVTKLWKTASLNGGAMPWVFGLLGQDHCGGASHTLPLKIRVIAELTKAWATTADLAVIFERSTNAMSATVSALLREGQIRRVGLSPNVSRHGGKRPWIFGVGAGEYKERPVPGPKHRQPDPARIAGRTYMRQYANWGAWS